jgi:hypothetical protein
MRFMGHSLVCVSCKGNGSSAQPGAWTVLERVEQTILGRLLPDGDWDNIDLEHGSGWLFNGHTWWPLELWLPADDPARFYRARPIR